MKRNIQRRNLWHFGEAVLYILLLLFFTYTFLAVECLKDVDRLYAAYRDNQATLFALMTNFGLYFMLLIDYQSGRSKIPNWVMWSMAGVILMDIVIYGDAKVLSDSQKYAEFQTIIGFPNAFIWLHLSTVALLVFLKYKSLEEITVSEKF